MFDHIASIPFFPALGKLFSTNPKRLQKRHSMLETKREKQCFSAKSLWPVAPRKPPEKPATSARVNREEKRLENRETRGEVLANALRAPALRRAGIAPKRPFARCYGVNTTLRLAGITL